MSSEDSESGEEISELMKEAANCDYVNKLYNNSYTNKETSCKPNKIAKTSEEEGTELSSHQTFLAKSLTSKLDGLISIVDNRQSQKNLKKHHHRPVSGIKLLKDSILIDKPEIEELSQRRINSNVVSLKENDRIELAKEAAVSPEWILSSSNTATWRFYKPKITYMNVDQRVGDKLLCSVVSSTY